MPGRSWLPLPRLFPPQKMLLPPKKARFQRSSPVGPAAIFAADECFYGRTRNAHTRPAYLHAVKQFLTWCELRRIELPQIAPKARKSRANSSRLMARMYAAPTPSPALRDELMLVPTAEPQIPPLGLKSSVGMTRREGWQPFWRRANGEERRANG